MKNEQRKAPADESRPRRSFISYSWKKAHYRICSALSREICDEIRRQRGNLESYIRRQPSFATSFTPLPRDDEAPDIAKRMFSAALKTGVGPMAAVAGAIAQAAAESAIRAGASEAIVENGGDIYMHSPHGIVVGLYAGKNPIGGNLALVIPASSLPLAVCSSSGIMGHSISLGKCDLATVFSKDASLADAAATLAGNLVSEEKDIESALKRILGIRGVLGALLVKNDRIGIAGDVPPLVKNSAPDLEAKISKDDRSDFR